MNTNETLNRAESSRINGSKSNGPRTEAGKERSSQNRTTHGMYSARVVLRNESQETYEGLEAAFVQLFQPRDAYEVSCLTDMIVARWRIRRLRTADTANIELAIEDARVTLHGSYNNLTPAHELALAYRSLPQSHSSANLLRLENQQQRLYDRSYRALARHRGKNTALPSGAAIAEAESSLPPDNFVDCNPFETNRDTQNDELEPESPPDPAPLSRTTAPAPGATDSKDEQASVNPDMVDRSGNHVMQAIYEAIDATRPELRWQVEQALKTYKARIIASKAA